MKKNIWIDGSTTRLAYIIEDFAPRVLGLPKKATVNEGEYHALIYALREAIDLGFLRVSVWSDSQLIVRQVNGQYKCRNDRMKILLEEAQRLIALFQSFKIIWLPREENKAGWLLE